MDPLTVWATFLSWESKFWCLQASFLFLDSDSLRYLTNGQPSIERFPISFKTYFSGNYFHHVVLGIYCNGRYGSLGMSRRAELMDKPLTFRTLSDLIFDFEDSYKKYLHTVKKVKIGLYVPHEPHSFQPIEWKQLVLNVSKMLRADIRKELEKYARDMRMKVGAGEANEQCKRVLSSFSPSLSLPPSLFLYCHVPRVSEMVKSFLRLPCLVGTLLKKYHSIFDMDNLSLSAFTTLKTRAKLNLGVVAEAESWPAVPSTSQSKMLVILY